MRAAPWHRPIERCIYKSGGTKVTVTDVYLSHYIAAAIYAAWRTVRAKP